MVRRSGGSGSPRAGRRARLAFVLGGVAVVLAVAVAAVVVAVRDANRADAEAVAAEARRVGAQALVAEDIDQSLLLAVEGVRLDDAPATRANLLAALTRSPQLIGSARGEGEAFYRFDVRPGAQIVGAERGGFYQLAVSPDGRVVAVYDDANRLWFYDADTRDVVGSFDAYNAASDATTRRLTSPLAFRPSGGQLAVGVQTLSREQRLTVPSVPVRLLDSTTFTEEPAQLGGLPDKPALPVDLDYSADGRLLAVSLDNYARRGTLPLSTWVAESSSVMVWDLETPELPIVRIDRATVFNSVALGPDGRSLYVGTTGVDAAPSVTVYDIGSGQPLRTFGGPGFPLEVSPDGTLLASASGPDILLFDAATGQERSRLRGHTAAVTNLRFSDDGLLASVSDDRSAMVWDLAIGQPREQLRGHAGAVRGLGFSPDDTTLYTVGTDRRLLVWDMRGDRRFIPRRAIPEPVAIDNGRVLAAPTGDAIAYAWTDTDDAGILHARLRFLDLDTSRAGPVIDTGHFALGELSWRPDGARLATAGQDGFVRVWDWRTGDLLGERRVTDAPAAGLDYTADGARIVVADPSGSISTIDGDTLEPDGTAVQIAGRIVRVDASPDNRTAIALTGGLASFPQLTESVEASPNSGFALVDLGSGRLLVSGDGQDAGLADLSEADFSPDGHRVAVGGSGGRVTVLDIETGEPAPVAATGHDDLVLRVAFAPDGTTFVSAGIDGRVALWDGHNGVSLGIVPADHRNSPATAEFLPDDHTVLITSYDGSVHTWDTDRRYWIDYACAVAGRNLTPAEWRVFFAERPYRETCASR